MRRGCLLVLLCSCLGGLSACDAFDEELPGCTTNLECTVQASSGNEVEVPAVCVGQGSARRCERLLSETCYKFTAGSGREGDPNDAYKNDQAIIIGSLFETGGPTGTGTTGQTNLRREESAILAVQEINTVRGIPSTKLEAPHPLVLVSCDSSTNLLGSGGAAEHLIERLEVPAIVGPNQSQDVLDLTPYSAPRHTVLLSPTGVASSIADTPDDGFTYQMVPNDLQRAPLLNDQINDLENIVRLASPKDPVRIAVVFRDDALGQGTQQALNSLTFNGAPLAQSPNRNEAALIVGYHATETGEDESIVSSLLDHEPHIVVLAGNQELVTRFITGRRADPPTAKLEEQWQAAHPDAPRPYYVGIDSTKNAALFTATRNDATGNDLRRRVRGTGVTPGAESQSVLDQFTNQYLIRYPNNTTNVSGMGSTYDAVYAIALAIAASDEARADERITGDSVKAGLHRLSGGETVTIEQSTLTGAFRKLGSGERISAIGTFGPLAWTESGAKRGGIIEVWCLRAGADAGDPPQAESSGRQYDVGSDTLSGTFDAESRCP
jgi:ABC-type branched-subunit amino acid transport system substrate-binding protein